MTTIAFIIGLIVGLIIGYFIGKSRAVAPEPKVPDHDLKDSEVDQINDELLLEGGKYQVNLDNGMVIRYISVIDAIMLSLNNDNKEYILDHCKNLDTAARILKQGAIDNGEIDQVAIPKSGSIETSARIVAGDQEEITELIEKGEPIEFAKFSKLCPPPDDPPVPEDLWGPEAMYILMNGVSATKLTVTVIDPKGNELDVPGDGIVYYFGDIVVRNNKEGIHRIQGKITDLRLGNTAIFDLPFAYKPS